MLTVIAKHVGSGKVVKFQGSIDEIDAAVAAGKILLVDDQDEVTAPVQAAAPTAPVPAPVQGQAPEAAAPAQTLNINVNGVKAAASSETEKKDKKKTVGWFKDSALDPKTVEATTLIIRDAAGGRHDAEKVIRGVTDEVIAERGLVNKTGAFAMGLAATASVHVLGVVLGAMAKDQK